jgi:hypothetical protein
MMRIETLNPEYDIKKIPAFQCSKIVKAFKISEIKQSDKSVDVNGGSWEIIPENKKLKPLRMPHYWIDKHHPKAGGYIVIDKDGYVSYSHAGAFEDSHTEA